MPVWRLLEHQPSVPLTSPAALHVSDNRPSLRQADYVPCYNANSSEVPEQPTNYIWSTSDLPLLEAWVGDVTGHIARHFPLARVQQGRMWLHPRFHREPALNRCCRVARSTCATPLSLCPSPPWLTQDCSHMTLIVGTCVALLRVTSQHCDCFQWKHWISVPSSTVGWLQPFPHTNGPP